MADSLDLFGEISKEEQLEIDKRRQYYEENNRKKLNALPTDPLQRTMAENRLVFMHQRRALYGIPGIHEHILLPTECQHVLKVCSTLSDWTKDRHSAFATTDIPIRDNPQLNHLEPLIKQRLFPELANHYQFKPEDLEFRDIFLVKYSANAQKGLKIHTDGCLFSLTLLISHPDDFEGGGTYYKSIDKVLHLNQGDVAYHDACVMHSGIDITKGTRYILVGFIDTLDTIQKDRRAAKKTSLRTT